MSRILIVDDEHAIGWSLRELLSDDGHAVEIAADIETALESLKITTALMVSWCEEHAPVIVEHPRCTGGRTVDEWSRPDCTELVDYSTRADGSVSYRGDGLCVACRKRRQRWEYDQAHREDVA
jgi:CheY-like chemotaxis protein